MCLCLDHHICIWFLLCMCLGDYEQSWVSSLSCGVKKGKTKKVLTHKIPWQDFRIETCFKRQHLSPPQIPFKSMYHSICIKTIKPLESNLEDLGFPEFPGKAEAGWRHRAKKKRRFRQKQASVQKHSQTQQRQRYFEVLTSKAPLHPAICLYLSYNHKLFVLIQWWDAGMLV